MLFVARLALHLFNKICFWKFNYRTLLLSRSLLGASINVVRTEVAMPGVFNEKISWKPSSGFWIRERSFDIISVISVVISFWNPNRIEKVLNSVSFPSLEDRNSAWSEIWVDQRKMLFLIPKIFLFSTSLHFSFCIEFDLVETVAPRHKLAGPVTMADTCHVVTPVLLPYGHSIMICITIHVDRSGQNFCPKELPLLKAFYWILLNQNLQFTSCSSNLLGFSFDSPHLNEPQPITPLFF